MCRVHPRLVSELCCEPLLNLIRQFLQTQLCFSDRQAGKHSFMFDEGTSTPDLCPLGMVCMCKFGLFMVKSVPVCVPRRMASWHSGVVGFCLSGIVSGDCRLFPG